MAARWATHPRKAEMQIAALQVAIDHIGGIGPPDLGIGSMPIHCSFAESMHVPPSILY
jgi:hypothetical protein